jgi:hypothetical protein
LAKESDLARGIISVPTSDAQQFMRTINCNYNYFFFFRTVYFDDLKVKQALA